MTAGCGQFAFGRVRFLRGYKALFEFGPFTACLSLALIQLPSQIEGAPCLFNCWCRWMASHHGSTDGVAEREGR